MTTAAVDHHPRRRDGAPDAPPVAPADSPRRATPPEQLRARFAAVRVSFTWLGVRRSLSAEQRARAAAGFGAQGPYLSAAKKLLDTRHDAFRRLTAVRGRVLSFWRGMSLPYPEPGLRLLRRDDLEAFDRRMGRFRAELAEAVADLDARYAELKDAARGRLGSLYSDGDYPPSLRDGFAVEWDFPSVEPPPYLLRLKPELYEQERARLAARFEEAARLAEQAFISEFAGLVAHLVERLDGGGGDGSNGSAACGPRKVFRDSAVTNLTDFFDRFRHLALSGGDGSGGELERLVEAAKAAVAGRDPRSVRDNEALRRQIASQLAQVRTALGPMIVERPRRRILRQPVDARAREVQP